MNRHVHCLWYDTEKREGQAMIDFHTHFFPEQLASRAMKQLAHCSGGLEPVYDGTRSGLVERMRLDGIDLSVALMIATKPSQESSVNRFAVENNHGPVICFGSVHPRSRQVLDHLKQLKEAGIIGIKLHPDYQDFDIDDPDAMRLYAKAAELGLITVFHMGLDIGYDYPGKSRPAALARALPAFQGAPVVAAHFGGYMRWEEVRDELVGKTVYFDTSYCHSRIPAPIARRLIREHGVDRFLFGSDAPWSSPRLEAGMIRHMDLTESEQAAILDGNARKLLGLH